MKQPFSANHCPLSRPLRRGNSLRNLVLVGLLALSALHTKAAEASADPDEPASELSSFQVAPGFEVKLFASEKDGVQKPIQMRFDARGRLWVIGSTVYPQLEPGQVPNDKVLILEDTNHDGVCDKTTVFADGLMIPTGLEVGHGGAYVGHGTELLFLKDNDGDDKADERRVLLRGFGTGDNHQNINSFLWGPGGELWMSQGLHTFSKVETPWGLVQLEKAGLWRFWPKRLKLEGYYGSEHEPQNPWGFSFTHWGEPIVNAGNNSSPIYPVPGLVASRRNDPPPLIWKNGNGRKTSGGDIVGTTHFPDSWQGLLILGGYINNAVWALQIKEDGAGFRLEDAPPLITSTSRKFRPVDVKFGPDGALYVCDWYNPIIGHYQASFRHPERDKTRGRIWRVTAKGRPLTPLPKFHQQAPAQIVSALSSPDRWARRFAKRALADLPREAATNALHAWIQDGTRTDHELTEALGVYQSHEVVAPQLLERLTRAKDAGARAYAAGVVGLWADRLPDALGLISPLVKDEHPRVRLQAVVACARVPQPQALQVLLEAGKLPMDKFLSYGVNQAVFALKPVWKPALGTLRLEQTSLDLLIRADASPDTLEFVRTSLRLRSDPTQHETLCQALLDYGNASDLAAVLATARVGSPEKILPRVVAAVKARNLRPKDDPEGLLEPFTRSSNPAVLGEALKLAALWKVQTLLGQARALATNETAHPVARQGAVEALGEFGGQVDLLKQLASNPAEPVQAAAIVTLAGLDTASAVPLAAAALREPRSEPFYAQLTSAFLQRRGAGKRLAQALKSQGIPRQAAEAGLRVLAASGRTEPELLEVFNTAAGLQTTERLTLKEVPSLVQQVREQGDARRGAAVFARASLGCVACHVVNGQGGNLGPNLSALGTAQPIDFIIGAILEPQKEIKEGFVSVSVLLKNGEEYQGYLLRESREEVLLRDVLKNEEVRLRRELIKEQKQHGSVMPAGLTDALSRQDFCDLVKYLSELGRPVR